MRACRRIVRKAPELAEIFAERVVDLLHDQRNQAVQLCGVTLMLEVRPPARPSALHERACTRRLAVHPAARAPCVCCSSGWCSAAPSYAYAFLCHGQNG